jgi:molybdopterin-guanine dinucleotide biosynthesis protein
MIVLVSGKMGSGKTTLCEKLATISRQRGYAISRVSFEEPIYRAHDAAISIMNASGWNIDQDIHLIRALRDEWLHKHHEGKLIDMVKTQCQNFSAANKKAVLVVDDMRFKNQFDAFPDAVKIRMVCDEPVRRSRAVWWGHQDHESETGLDEYQEMTKFDLIIETTTINADETAKIAANFIWR